MFVWLRRLCSLERLKRQDPLPPSFSSRNAGDEDNGSSDLMVSLRRDAPYVDNKTGGDTGASAAPRLARLGAAESPSMHSKSPEFRASASRASASDGVPSSTLEQSFSDPSVQQEGSSGIFGVICTNSTYVEGSMMVSGYPDTLVKFGTGENSNPVLAAGGGVSSE